MSKVTVRVIEVSGIQVPFGGAIISSPLHKQRAMRLNK